jgi:hypothetical protein
LLGLFEDKHKLIDAVDLVLDALDERAKGVGNVVNKRVRDPVGRDRDVVLEVFDTTTDVLRVGRATEVELGHVSDRQAKRQAKQCSTSSVHLPTACPLGTQ